MSLKHLTSKLLAGGLTAGIVLIWWPHHYPTDGLEWLVLRGIVATLGFELMMRAYAPIEDRIVAGLARRRAFGRLRERAQAVPAPARTGGSMLFASAALALPLMLLASSGGPLSTEPETQPVKVVREVVVKREVVHDTVAVPSDGTAPSVADGWAAGRGGAGGSDGDSATRSSTAGRARDGSSAASDRKATRTPQPASGDETQRAPGQQGDTSRPSEPTTSASADPAPAVEAGTQTVPSDPAAAD